MKIFLHQHASLPTPEQTLQILEQAFAQAERENCQLLVAPEVFLSGFDYAHLKEIGQASIEQQEKICSLCNKYGVAFYGSFFSYRFCARKKSLAHNSTKPFNQALLIDKNGEIISCYNKIHLIPAFREDEFLQAGDSVCETFFSLPSSNVEKKIRLGLAICYDLRFPELFREYAKKEVEVFLICAQWPLSRVEHMLALSRARAIENQAFVVLVNSVGGKKNVMGGCSHVFDAQGNLLINLQNQEQGASVELDISSLHNWRESFPALYQFSREKNDE